jgi:transposase-like protein
MLPHCPLCGRFMRKRLDAYTGALAGWQCPKVWYAGEGQWEHD